jgi:hypothetical protein
MAKRKSYTVGRGRPPIKSRWQPGQSGNPNGRPRRVKGIQSLQAAFGKVLTEKVLLPFRGRMRRLALHDIVARAIVKKAAEGDMKAISLLLEYARFPEANFEHVDPDFIKQDPVRVADTYRRLIADSMA